MSLVTYECVSVCVCVCVCACQVSLMEGASSPSLLEKACAAISHILCSVILYFRTKRPTFSQKIPLYLPLCSSRSVGQVGTFCGWEFLFGGYFLRCSFVNETQT